MGGGGGGRKKIRVEEREEKESKTVFHHSLMKVTKYRISQINVYIHNKEEIFMI
jgi:hypothetical protein